MVINLIDVSTCQRCSTRHQYSIMILCRHQPQCGGGAASDTQTGGSQPHFSLQLPLCHFCTVVHNTIHIHASIYKVSAIQFATRCFPCILHELELVTCSSVLVTIRESGAPYLTRELSSRSEYNIKDPYFHSSVLTSTSFLFPSY